MSITVNIYYSGSKENLNGFVNEMLSNGIVDRIREQQGNLKYEYFIPVEQSDKILLIDQWTTQEALDIHHSSSMMKEILDLRKKYELSMEVQRFISDDDGITDNDKKFIN